MIERLGVIPAAGKAERWGGLLKEFLPLQDGVTLMDRTLSALMIGGCDATLIITNRDKLQAHANHLKNWQMYYAIQLGAKDIWSAIMESLPMHGRMNYFAMPDTYYPINIFTKMGNDHFNIGYADTDRPDQCGVLTEHGIVNKQQMPPGIYKGWGVLSWSGKVAQFWIENINNIKTYTQAFNMAIDNFGFSITKMDYFHNMHSWNDYKELVNAG